MSDGYSLTAVDIVLIVAVLVFVCAQGIYHGWKQKKSTKEFFTASRRFSGLPVAMSLLLSFLSAVTLLGVPAEIYVYGLGYAAYILSYLWMYPLITWVFVPVFHSLPLISAYEYCEMRYNYTVRVLTSSLFILQMSLFMAIVLIGPALALEVVTGISFLYSVFITGGICIFYASLGGMAAVVWTDAVLFIVILVDLILIVVLGTIETGGVSYIWEYNKADGRLAESIFYFPFDITERTTFMNCVIGFGVNYIPVYLNQANIQRYISTETTKQAKISVMLNLPFQFIFLPILFYCGLMLYAFYNNHLVLIEPAINATFPPDFTYPPNDHGDVEPRHEPDYTSPDQIMVYFVSDQFGHIPGFMGLFMSSILAGTLSTVAGGVNALIAVTLEDFVKPWRRWRSKRTGKPVYENDKRDTYVGKILTIVYGLLAIGLAILASQLESLITMGNTIFGTTGGPIIAVFFMGLFYKRSTAWATVIGIIVGFGMISWVFVGSMVYAGRLEEGLFIYSLSFMWYATFSSLITLLVAIPLSEIHRCFSKSEREKSVDPALLATCLRPKGWTSKYVKRNEDVADETDGANSDVDKETDGDMPTFENPAFDEGEGDQVTELDGEVATKEKTNSHGEGADFEARHFAFNADEADGYLTNTNTQTSFL
ncbi:sodium-coupled monocarboxylate transporter 1-like [Ptychodera flava]|uniref:sodium-coupled monocarboxylate transporter 1-like n=1 Tax=Ptychodera flava TaxID=63121 RepID=UPI003969F499